MTDHSASADREDNPLKEVKRLCEIQGEVIDSLSNILGDTDLSAIAEPELEKLLEIRRVIRRAKKNAVFAYAELEFVQGHLEELEADPSEPTLGKRHE